MKSILIIFLFALVIIQIIVMVPPAARFIVEIVSYVGMKVHGISLSFDWEYAKKGRGQ